MNATVDLGPNAVSLIEQLAKQIGVTVKEVYPYFVKQSMIEGYTSLSISAALYLIAIIVSFIIYFKRKTLCSNAFQILIAVTIVITLLISIPILGELPNNISKVTNPEYHAMQKIADSVRKLR